MASADPSPRGVGGGRRQRGVDADAHAHEVSRQVVDKLRHLRGEQIVRSTLQQFVQAAAHAP
jgi:hypothetical protein